MKRIRKVLFFFMLMMPGIVFASDYVVCGSNKRFPLVVADIISPLYIIIRVLVPAILVISGIVTFVKATTSGNPDDDLNKAKNKLVVNIVSAIIIFFLVSIVKFAVALVAGSNNTFNSCLNCMIKPSGCNKQDSEFMKLCPGLIGDQSQYDENCNYIGEKRENIDYGTGETGIQDPEPSNNNSGGTSSGIPSQIPSGEKSTGNKNIEVVDGVTYVDGVLIVNKTYGLPSNYKPASAGDEYVCPTCLTDETLKAYNELKDAASKVSGLRSMTICSGYRSYSLQVDLYNSYVNRDGKDKADTYSARPGYSEHQTGLAFDVIKASSSFDSTKEAKWLNDNCYKYGFIIRYPKNKTNVTGYKYESWHLRYVGKELAEKLYNGGNWITLEEYFGLTSVYSD